MLVVLLTEFDQTTNNIVNTCINLTFWALREPWKYFCVMVDNQEQIQNKVIEIPNSNEKITVI